MTTSPEPGVLALADSFPPRTIEEWRELARAVVNKSRAEGAKLTGEQAEDVLRSHLPGDLTVDPLYVRPAEDRPTGYPGAMPFTRGRGPRERTTPWDVRALHEHPDVDVTRAAVADDLDHGVTSLWLRVGADGIAAADVAEVLADVALADVPVAVSSWDDQGAAADALLAALDAAGVPGAGSLGHDPIGLAARRGGVADLSAVAPAMRACLDRSPLLRAVTVDATVYHDAGAGAVDEIALAVATGLTYLRAAEAAGIAVRPRGRARRVPARGPRRPVPHDRLGPRPPPALGPRR